MDDMDSLTPTIQARRAAEDRVARLAEERRDLDNRVAANTQAIVAAMPEALDAGMTFDQLAELIGVSRQTLYRWPRDRRNAAAWRNGRPGLAQTSSSAPSH
jgi:CRP-like cAMP-binding protein